MNAKIVILSLSFLCVSFLKAEEVTESSYHQKHEYSYKIDIKNPKSLFFGVIGAFSAYRGLYMINIGIEMPFYSLTRSQQKDPHEIENFFVNTIFSIPHILIGSLLFYLGYKLITKDLSENSEHQD